MLHHAPAARRFAGFPAIVGVLLTLSALVSVGVLLAPDFAERPAEAPRSQTRIGINPAGVSDYSPDQLFADAIRGCRGFNAPDAPWKLESAVPTDAEGWPQADFGVLLNTARPRPKVVNDGNGTYGVRFQGQAEIVGWLSEVKVHDLRYDAATNTTTALVDALAGGNNGIGLSFRATRRSPADLVGSGLSQVQVMRPTAAGSSTPHNFDEVFSRQALKMLGPFAFHRNLDLNSTNNGGPERGPWSGRQRPASRWFCEKAIPYEDQVALANACGADLWLTVQMNADDDHVRRLFQLCRYGSDGVNPYTSDQPKPTFAPLRGRLIIEYDNELWNFGFAHSHANVAAAEAEVAAGKSDLDYDRCGNKWYWGCRRVAAQTLRLREIAAEVYGEQAFGTQFLPVLMGQQGGQDSTGFFGLQLGLDYLKHHDRRPLTQLLAAAGTSWYHSPTVLVAAQRQFEKAREAATKAGQPAPTWTWPTPDEVFTAGPAAQFPAIDNLARFLRSYNLPMACYEGGEVFEQGGPSDAAAIGLIQKDPRFAPFVRTTIDQAVAAGPLFLAVFNTTQSPWGLVDSCQNLDTPKYTATVEALRDYDAGPLAKPSPTPSP